MTATPEPVLVDAAQRARIETELSSSFVVEAAAGSGKTTLLVRRLVALVVQGVPLRSIVATTFTERAAGEITLRLRAELELLRQVPDPKRRAAAERALLEMEDARIGTLHGIAGELLREVPLEAGIDPDFVVLGPDEARALRERVVRAHLAALLSAPPEGLRRWLRRAPRPGDPTPIDRLTSALEALSEQRDLAAPWSRPAGFARDAAIDALLGQLGALLEAAERTTLPHASKRDGLEGSLAALRSLWRELTETEGVATRDHDAIEARLSSLSYKERDALNKPGRASSWADKAAFAALKAQRDAFLEAQTAFVRDASADLAALLRADLWPALERYEEAKRKEGALDFHDLIALLRATLVERPEVRRIFSERISHVVVDEVQDTDPLQLDIVALLASDDPRVADPEAARPGPGKLFVVGDPKQSIYAFRRSSVDGYLRFRDRMIAHGAELIELTSTFRCVPSIAALVDRAARASFVPGPFQPAYAGLSPVRSEPLGRPSVIALPVPKPYGYRGDVHLGNVREALPEEVAGLLQYILRESGWRIPDPRTGAEVPIAPRHVVLLARNFSSFGADQVGPFARALSRRGIPHAHIGGRSFHEQEEIVALRAAANAIEFPDDELSVYATLRGPFLALADADLFTYRGTVGKLHPLTPRPDPSALTPAHQPIAEALALLAELHRKRARRSIEETMTRFATASAAFLSLAAAADGDLSLARAHRWIELAAQREARGALSFRRFVEALEDAADRKEDVVALPPDGLDAVRFSTVHLAKGLEWPVVILIDPATKPEGPAKVIDTARGLYVDSLLGLEPQERHEYAEQALERGRAEGARLLYVAASRARDLLVVPTTGDGPIGQWLSPLEVALRPEAPRDAQPAPGCPPFGKRTVLMRGDHHEIDEPPASEVAPGLHRVGEARVVFWDPELTSRGAPPVIGVRGQALFAEVKGVDGSASHRALTEARQRIDATAHRGSVEVTSLRAPSLALHAPELEVIVLPIPVHATPSARLALLLRSILAGPVLTDPARRSARLARRATELGSPDEEQAAVQRIAEAILADPDLGALAPSFRFVPLTAVVGARHLVEGEALLTDHSDDAGGVVVLEVHASGEPEAQVKARLQIAADVHRRASGRPALPYLVTLEPPA